ncbi:MAG: hypothetical protein ACRCWG_13010 [Sarcina sp.]
MKVVIVAPTLIKEMPYFYYYYNLLKEEKNLNLTVLNWKRYESEDDQIENQYTYKNNIGFGKGILTRGIGFLGYQKFVLQKLSDINPDKIIVLCPQTICFIYKKFINRYRNKYIIDIRDYSPTIKIKFWFNQLLKNSKLVSISSKGYLEWINLPKNIEYVISHNISKEVLLNNSKVTPKALNKKKIKVATIGALRDYEGNSKVIDELGDLEEVEVGFYGKGIAEEELKEYVVSKEFKNIKFFGYYEKELEGSIYQKVDFVNVYTESINNKGTRTLLPNRLYNAVKYGKPLIVREKTYLAKLVKKYNLGIAVTLDEENLSEKIKNYIEVNKEEDFKKGRKSFLDMVILENKEWENKVFEIIKG